MNFMSVYIKLILGFLLLFIATKIMGRQQLSQVTLFDFISAVILGEIIGNALYDPDINLIHVIGNLLLWVSLKIAIEIAILKSINLRVFFDSRPAIIINKGEIDRKQLRKNRLTVHQLLMMIRENGIFTLSEIEYAILESDGKLSVMKKSEYQTPTMKDLQLPTKPDFLPRAVIIDGIYIKENLQLTGVTKEWIKDKLAEQGYLNPKKVLYAEVKNKKNLFVTGTTK